MDDSVPLDVETVWDSFHQVVNMTSEELRAWLLAEDSGEEPSRPAAGSGLPELGLKVVDILHKRKVDLTAADADVMAQVTDFVTEQENDPPPDGAGNDEWRWSLMTVGHDPLKR
ncbi:MAG TPA: DUF3140 domain-containing protein [Trebonia sp.]|jgi:hypothetical protein|nr:DUF3140 domain-containing protein [Trebonia sp.]